eukprot:1356106-Rhodomonas_salina.1
MRERSDGEGSECRWEVKAGGSYVPVPALSPSLPLPPSLSPSLSLFLPPVLPLSGVRPHVTLNPKP